MKKMLAMLCALAMVLGLCACGGEKEPVGPGGSEANPNINPPQTYEPPEDPGISGPLMGGSLGSSVPESVENGTFDEDISRNLAQVIQDYCELTEDITLLTGSECLDYLEPLLGLDSAYVGAAAMAIPMMSTRAYAVILLKANSNGDDPITGALNTYQQTQMDNFYQYLPEQYELAQMGSIFTEGGYFGLVMGEAAGAADSIQAALQHGGEAVEP